MARGSSAERQRFFSRGGEEGVLWRSARTYFGSAVAGALVCVAGLAWWLDLDRVAAVLGVCATLLVAAQPHLDRAVACWWRWPIVAQDAGLVAAGSGVPDVVAVVPRKAGVAVTVSWLAFDDLDAIDAEDRVARGLGYAAGAAAIVPGRWRKARRRARFELARSSGLAATVPIARTPLDANRDSVQVGVDKALRPIEWHVVDMPGHVIIQGETRSGKSVLAYGMLAQLCAMDNVAVRMVDYTGILQGPFSRFDPDCAAPNVRNLGDDRMMEVAEFVEREVAEMDERIGYLARSMRDKVEEVTPDFPARVIVFEEYAGLLERARSSDSGRSGGKRESTAVRIESAVGRLVAEGAKAAVRVILLTQRGSAKTVDSDTRSNFAIRITLRVSAFSSMEMLHDDLDESWSREIKQYRNGVGVIEMPGELPQKFRAVYIGAQQEVDPTAAPKEAPPEFETYLQLVRAGLEMSAAAKRIAAESVIEMEGEENVFSACEQDVGNARG